MAAAAGAASTSDAKVSSLVPRAVLQTNFTPTQGNALQACVASVFGLELDAVPNFLAAPDYAAALHAWLLPRGLTFVKLNAAAEPTPTATAAAGSTGAAAPAATTKPAPSQQWAGVLPFPVAAHTVLIAAGPSPRGAHRHCVVASVHGAHGTSSTGLALAYDPYPDHSGLAGRPVWVGFFVSMAPAAATVVASSTTAASTVAPAAAAK